MDARTLRGFASVGILLAFALAAAAPAAGHENPNHGTIKVHDDAVGQPNPQANNPHVSCQFWVEGFDITDGSGTLVFTEKPPTAGDPPATETHAWTADSGSEEDGYHFNAGPFTLEPGHWRVDAYVGDAEGHPGDTHQTKSKVFWVDLCDDGGPQGGHPPCPPGVAAQAEDNGDVNLTWGAATNATSYNVYRSQDGDDPELVATVTGTSYHDTDTTAGSTYQYRVAAFDGVQESVACPEVEVTAIPFFTDALTMGLAGAGGLAAFAVARRRRS